ncbi:MAG: zinc dependent phospholipase C family protein [Candidatus Izemoplasma sp.]|nr:zinc dependent phospholipase C family protein [Candidatus Izemoplasma sp.]
MPDFYMHAKFAKEIEEILPVSLDTPSLLLGAQGPDPFYYKVLGGKTHDYRYYADRLHDTDTAKSLSLLTTYVKTHPNQKLISFYIGYLCHYALDVTVHPYIYHHVGVYDVNQPTTHPWRGLHLRFERAVDIKLIEHDYDIKAHQFNVNSLLPKYNTEETIDYAISHIIHKTFDSNPGLSYTVASKAMKRTLKWMVRDRFGMKRLLYKGLDRFNHKTDLFLQDLSLHAKPIPFDYLNIDHHPWHHPITNQKSTASVFDLYDQAKEFVLNILDTVLPYIEGKGTVDLSTVFTNLSFNTGINCDRGSKMKYIQIYTEKQQ